MLLVAECGQDVFFAEMNRALTTPSLTDSERAVLKGRTGFFERHWKVQQTPCAVLVSPRSENCKPSEDGFSLLNLRLPPA